MSEMLERLQGYNCYKRNAPCAWLSDWTDAADVCNDVTIVTLLTTAEAKPEPKP